MYSQSKRPRLGPQRRASRSPPRTEPSKIVFVGDLLANTTEHDVYQEMQQYGSILSVTLMPRNGKALVEFEQQRDAEALVEGAKSGRRVHLRGCPVVVNYSRSAQINASRKEYKSATATELLLLTVYRTKVEVNIDAIRRIAEPFGRLTRATLLAGHSPQAVLEFSSVEVAARAKPKLNGADIYADCNTLRCEFVTRRVYELLPLEGCTVVQEWPLPGAGAGGHYRGGRGGGGGCLLDGGGSEFDIAQQYNERHRLSTDYHQQYQPRGHGIRDDVLVDHEDRYESWRQSGGSNSRQQQYLYPPQPLQPPPPMTAADTSGCILHICDLPDSVNCDRLFNLLCLYGNVRLIKFFASKRGEALIEMMDKQSAMLCVSFLNDECILGGHILLEISRQSSLRSVREPVNLPDGTPSIKAFDQQRRSLNRFLSDQSFFKSPPVKPGNMVYFWGFPPHGSEADLRRLLGGVGAPDPPEVGGIEFLSADHKTGLLKYQTTEEALTAICLANHAQCQLSDDQRPWMLKMCFSSSTRRQGRSGGQRRLRQTSEACADGDGTAVGEETMSTTRRGSGGGDSEGSELH